MHSEKEPPSPIEPYPKWTPNRIFAKSGQEGTQIKENINREQRSLMANNLYITILYLRRMLYDFVHHISICFGFLISQ